MVLVGATIVGSMATVWHGIIDPPRPSEVREWPYAAGQVTLKRGEEMGRFMLGSTVVMLFARSAGLRVQPQVGAGPRDSPRARRWPSVTPPPTGRA